MWRRVLSPRLLWSAALLLPSVCGAEEGAGGPVGRVRPPAVAGGFYPGDAESLKKAVEGFLAGARGRGASGEVMGVLVPHAGYAFSGKVAAFSYAAVDGGDFDLVLVLAPPHRCPVKAASVGLFDAYETPLGSVPVAVKDARRLLAEHQDLFAFVPEAHRFEHSIEVQCPFIRTVLPGKPILPVLVGSDSPEVQAGIADALYDVLGGRRALVVISSDLSHYPDYETAREADAETLRAVVSMDPDDLRRVAERVEREYRSKGLVTAACGLNALLVGLRLLGKMGADGASLLRYANSGDAPAGAGRKDRVVGYGAVVFFRKEERKVSGSEGGLSVEAKKELLEIARKAVEAAVKGEPLPEAASNNPELQERRGVFVTLKTHGRLRGCLGNFTSEKPLWLEVRDMARESALRDPRFVYDRIRPEELPEVDIEISVLSPLEEIEDPLDFELGKHGIYVIRGSRRGVFLPQVATEMGWGKEEFLSNLCAHKAGLPADAWKDPETKILRFSAEVFGEEEMK